MFQRPLFPFPLQGKAGVGGRQLAATFSLQIHYQPSNELPFLPMGSHEEEAFGTASKGLPANPFRTSPARKSARGAISSPTLAFSRAFTLVLRSPTGTTVQGYPPDAIIAFIRKRPTRPFPSV